MSVEMKTTITLELDFVLYRELIFFMNKSQIISCELMS